MTPKRIQCLCIALAEKPPKIQSRPIHPLGDRVQTDTAVAQWLSHTLPCLDTGRLFATHPCVRSILDNLNTIAPGLAQGSVAQGAPLARSRLQRGRTVHISSPVRGSGSRRTTNNNFRMRRTRFCGYHCCHCRLVVFSAALLWPLAISFNLACSP